MEEKFYKYADLLVNRCLAVKENQPLLVTAPIENIELVRIIARVAYDAGVRDIYFDFIDDVLKHDQMTCFSKEELFNSRLFNKSIYNEYAKKDAAFLMLYANNPDIMNDIDKEIISYTGEISITTRDEYRKKQRNYIVPWCIASSVTEAWAKKVLPNSKDAYNELWNIVFDLTLVNEENPIKAWDEKVKLSQERVKKLNDLKINTLTYKNSLGTNFSVGFNNNKWCGVGEHTTNGRNILVNMPSEEVFTSPDKFTANGKVYASMPLIYNSSLIEDFWIEFKDGKVIDFDAKCGKEVLESIIKQENGDYLGEVALVDKNSPIAKSGLLFYETLYDENASCHLALGSAFPDCFNDKDNLEKYGYNDSKTHVDFMIGTHDLEIIAETDNGNVTIMKDGEFVI